MKHISLFSGIGGFDLAAQWMGWTNVASCEIAEFPRKVLQHHWPSAYHHDDIHTLTYEKLNYELKSRFGIHWRSDGIVLSGGFPCQPYSLAGKRKGKEDARHLWPEMLRVIREVRPRWIVGENVFGLVNWDGGLVFHEVQSDLEAEGYEVQPFILPAASVNAPHRRDRVWFVAYCCGYGRQRHKEYTQRFKYIAGGEAFGKFNSHVPFKTATDAAVKGRENREQDGDWTNPAKNSTGLVNGIKRFICDGLTANPDQQQRRERRLYEAEPEKTERYISARDARSNAIPGWHDFPTQSPVCGRNDGLSTKLDGITFSKWRNESIKAYGNAVVPQVVYQIFKAIGEWEKLYGK